MNLLTDKWLPIVRRDGNREKIAIHELLDQYNTNPVMELEAPRPDFKNALYQLLIGIVQVAAMPEDEEDWADLFEEPYNSSEFSEMVLKYEECFDIDSEGPAFMQDLRLPEDPKRKLKPIYWMTMGSPGKNTIDENKAHFIKDSNNFVLDVYWAAVALFQLQTVGPPDGGGHREGLCGSGPLVTLLSPMSKDMDYTLWAKIWINIFPEEFVASWNGNNREKIFPWMKSTKSSTGDVFTYFDDLHPLSVYWSFPRRIRLTFKDKKCICSFSGNEVKKVGVEFDTFKHGTMYHNTWVHPFVPYQIENPDSEGKKKGSMRAIQENFSFSNWSLVSLPNSKYKNSKIISYFYNNRRHSILSNIECQIWISGFHMKSGEATVINWYEANWPLFNIEVSSARIFYDEISEIIKFTDIAREELLTALKKSWYTPRFDSKGKESWAKVVDYKKFATNSKPIATAFFDALESRFYSLLNVWIENTDKEKRSSLIEDWIEAVTVTLNKLFEEKALIQQQELSMKRIIKARNNMKFNINNAAKELKDNLCQEVL